METATPVQYLGEFQQIISENVLNDWSYFPDSTSFSLRNVLKWVMQRRHVPRGQHHIAILARRKLRLVSKPERSKWTLFAGEAVTCVLDILWHHHNQCRPTSRCSFHSKPERVVGRNKRFDRFWSWPQRNSKQDLKAHLQASDWSWTIFW